MSNHIAFEKKEGRKFHFCVIRQAEAIEGKFTYKWFSFSSLIKCTLKMKSTKKSHKLEHTEIIPMSSLLKPVVLGGIVIPISLFFWVFSALKANYLSSDGIKVKKLFF